MNDKKLLNYSIIETLNGNFTLKESSKVKETDTIEHEISGYNLQDINKQYKEHIKMLKVEGLI